MHGGSFWIAGFGIDTSQFCVKMLMYTSGRGGRNNDGLLTDS